VTEGIPASLLQNHADCAFILDEAAAAELTRFKSPWLTGEIEWTPKTIKKAVVNMALKTGKPVLSLTNHDYNEYGLGDLLIEYGDAYEINLKVYYMLRDSITGWPAGQTRCAYPAHPERSVALPQKSGYFFAPPGR
jgi:glucosamine-6-phosphate deaminase